MAPISFLNIHKFAKIMGIDDFDEFLYFIRILDDVYLKHAERKQKNAHSNAGQANIHKGQGRGK